MQINSILVYVDMPKFLYPYFVSTRKWNVPFKLLGSILCCCKILSPDAEPAILDGTILLKTYTCTHWHFLNPQQKWEEPAGNLERKMFKISWYIQNNNRVYLKIENFPCVSNDSQSEKI